MENKKILYIDMDGVIADFAKAITNINPDLDMSEDTENYEDRSKMVDEICIKNPNLFHHLEPMEKSIEIVKKLFEHFEVYFLSTPMWTVPESFSGKRIWIQKHFGEMAAKRLILTHRKDLNIGDYLVDDRKRNGAGEFRGEHIHYGTENFPNWEKVYVYLMENKNIQSYTSFNHMMNIPRRIGKSHIEKFRDTYNDLEKVSESKGMSFQKIWEYYNMNRFKDDEI